jgi:Type II intron maturase/Reverse transcriptase (RNA-dependent DNA polymerase)
MPSKDVNDPDYRRVSYLRYADDCLLAFIGPIAEAKAIKEKLSTFLKEQLKLDLSEEKTLITHAQTETAKFLGYHIQVQQEDTKHTEGRRSVNGIVGLRVPPQCVEEKSALYMRHGKPTHRPEVLDEDDFTIISLYQSEYRGYVQYYTLAQNGAWLNNVRTVMRLSLLKTLANKHKTSVARMRAKYQKTVRLPQGPRKCLEITVEREGKKPLIARFGGIPLKRDLKTQIQDLPTERKPPSRSELIKRLLADTCEVCGAVGNIEVPHIHALKDLKVKGKKEMPLWMQIMSARRRKTLMVCKPCHMAIQYGKPTKKYVSK